MPNLTAIILATCNGERWIREQIQSVLGQTHVDWRLFIRDDCSDDRTLEIAKAFAETDDRIVVLASPDARSGSASGNFLSTLLLI